MSPSKRRPRPRAALRPAAHRARQRPDSNPPPPISPCPSAAATSSGRPLSSLKTTTMTATPHPHPRLSLPLYDAIALAALCLMASAPSDTTRYPLSSPFGETAWVRAQVRTIARSSLFLPLVPVALYPRPTSHALAKRGWGGARATETRGRGGCTACFRPGLTWSSLGAVMTRNRTATTLREEEKPPNHQEGRGHHHHRHVHLLPPPPSLAFALPMEWEGVGNM
ncbi:hypothetical protein K525DRAFT_275677 [Schizophyllum commune Loenen D]|nr:hypothetical protein K525DRAFT_275677 [Schizophyllum commune Loenen D]